MRRVLALSLLIWSSGEYLVLPGSPAYAPHSPFLAPCCPATRMAPEASSKARTISRERALLRNIDLFPFPFFLIPFSLIPIRSSFFVFRFVMLWQRERNELSRMSGRRHRRDD